MRRQVEQQLQKRVATPIAISAMIASGLLGLAGITGFFSFIYSGPPGGPYVSNPDFSSGTLTPWSNFVADQVHNSVSVVNENIGSQGNMLKMVVTQLNATPLSWHEQVTQTNAALKTLQPSTLYELHFVAKASVFRSVLIEIPTLGFSRTIQIDTALTPYSMSFMTPATMPTSDPSLGIYTGDKLGTVWLDDFTVAPATQQTYSGTPIQVGTFEPGEEWFESIKYPSGLPDTVHVKQGTQGRMLTSAADNGMFTTHDAAMNLSASNWQLSFWVYTETPTTIGRMYAMFRPGPDHDDNDTWWSFSGLQTGWNKIVIPKEQFFHYYWMSTFDWANVRSLGIKLEANGNGPATVTIDDVKIEPASPTDIVPPAFLRVTPTAITSSSATIAWATNEAVTSSSVACATTPSYGSLITATAAPANEYSATLTGLSQNQLYHCRVQADDPTGNRGYTGDFTFLTKRTTPIVPTNSGEPFPTGIMTTGHLVDIRAGDFSSIKNVGQTDFSFAQTYYLNSCGESDTTITAYLNQAQSQGKKVMMSLCGTDELPATLNIPNIQQRVQKYKNHPAIFGWYAFDEPDLSSIDQTTLANALRTVYTTIKNIDAVHPVIIMLARATTYPTYHDTYDILLSDYYATQDEPVTAIQIDLGPSKASGQPFHFAWQAYSLEMQYWPWNNRNGQPLRFPSMGEMRALMYQSINSGAQGLWTYGYTYIHDTPGNEWHWAETLLLQQQLQDLAPMLNSRIVPSLQVSSTSTGSFDTSVKMYAGASYVLVQNTDPNPLTGTVTLNNAAINAATEIQSSQAATVASGVINVSLAGYGLQIYKISAADTTPPPAPTNVVDGLSGDVALTNNNASMSATWNAVSDPSTIDHYEVALGTTPGGIEIAPFTSVGNVTSTTRGGLALADGTYYIAVRAVDGAGNFSAAGVSNGLTVSSTPPTVNLTAPTAGVYLGGNAVVLSATASDADGVAGVQFKVDGNPVGNEDTGTPYSITWDSAGVADGVHSITATARDVVGNSATSSAVSVTIDNTAPPAPSIVRDGVTPGIDIQYSKSLSGLGANWATVVDTGSGLLRYQMAIGTTAGATDALPFTNLSTFTSNTISVTLVDGVTYYSSIRAIDKVGNIGPVSSSNGVTIDAVAPSVSMTAPLNGNFVTGSTVTVSANASDAIGVTSAQFRLDGANLGALLTGAPYNLSWNTTGLVNGSTHVITAIAKDAATNSTTATSVSITIDATAPTVSMTAPTAGTVVSGNTVAVTVTAADNNAVAGVQFMLDGAPMAVEDTSFPYSILWNSTTATDAVHALTAVARDGAGNTTTSAPVSITADNNPPTVSMIAPISGAFVSGNVVSLSATATDSISVVGVQFAIDGVDTQAEYTASPYTVLWNTTLATNTTHTLTARARDGIGNTATSAPVVVTVDNLAPIAPAAIRAGISGNQPYTNTATALSANWDAATDAGSGIGRYELAIGTTSGGAEIQSYTTVGTGTSATISSLHLVDGLYYMSVRAVDRALNVGPVATTSVTVDTVAPSVIINNPLTGTTISGTVAIVFTVADATGLSQVSYILDGVTQSTDIFGPYAWLLDTTVVSEGSHVLTLQAQDRAGNSTTSAAIAITVRNSVPCVEQWSCTAWNSCSSAGQQTRVCTDSHACGTTALRPVDQQQCTAPVVVTPIPAIGGGDIIPTSLTTITPRLTISSSKGVTSGKTVKLTLDPLNQTLTKTRFTIDGRALGTDSTAPYVVSWDSRTVRNGKHVIGVQVTWPNGVVTTVQQNVTVKNKLEVAIGIRKNAVVRGTVTIVPTIYGGAGIRQIRYVLDGKTTLTTRKQNPFQIKWDTKRFGTGKHTLTIQVTDVAKAVASTKVPIVIKR